MPYTPKYLKLDLLYLKRFFKTFKSFNKSFFISNALHSQIPQVRSFTPQESF